MDFYLSAILLGLGFSSMAMGIFISMKIFNIPDITTDGTFTLGGALTAVLIMSDFHSLLSMPAAFLLCAFAGAITGFIHAKMKVNALLAGILVMTALYSVNLAIMGKSNIPLIGKALVFEIITFAEDGNLNRFVYLFLMILICAFFLDRLLKTDFGIAMRATGNNEQMARSNGINTDRMKITGLAIANGFTGLSGYLITQVQGFADINMGIGVVILGLGSVMMGEMIVRLFGSNSIIIQITAVISGSILFRLVLAFALSIGIDPLYLKLVVAVFVLLIISIPNLRKSHA
ncbi:MAG: ABC transporter permease [Bacteroidetes bacterium]|nr:MAG: ABC transporter permease [Bacteroidota bacterium]REK06508.1 MAG: ABC transporter permease [Bacteroidota bacterium]REK33274.1 MAG: ABC transporter permease [Bacteroidota bacterium]REK47111.1 MAG: ABC transporter permease [Bacteroidota bacterium]